MEEHILDMIRDADMLLIGIGEEFEERNLLKEQPEYLSSSAYMEELERLDLLPLLADGLISEKGRAVFALQRLYQIIQNKDYFLISTCATDILKYAGFPEEKTVTPCGTLWKKQCINGCEESLAWIEQTDKERLYRNIIDRHKSLDVLGDCPKCHGKMVLNNVYLEKYLEKGYLDDWNRYTKWLQGTLNRKVCILELGVNLDYPSVIRFPFEKMGYYNQKAVFVRVNQRLYQLTEELHDKGISVAKNAIDWLLT